MPSVSKAVDALDVDGVVVDALPALDQLDFAERALVRAVDRIRKISAPPDGLTRPILPVGTGELARALGVPDQAVRDVAPKLAVEPKWNAQRTQRTFYPDDAYRIRQELIPLTTKRHTPPFVVSVCNQKGGVGKTTTSVGLAQVAAFSGLKVLLIDLDPQASTTACFLVEKEIGGGKLVEGGHADLSIEQTVSPLILGDLKDDGQPYAVQDLVRKTHWSQIDLIPAHPDLSEAEFGLIEALVAGNDNAFWGALRKALARLSIDDYQLIIIDTPPSMSLIAVSVMLASHGLLVPIPPRNLDVESLKSYTRTTKEWAKVVSKHFPLQQEWTRYVTSMMSPARSRVENRNDLILRQELGGSSFLPEPILKLEALQRASGGAPTPFEVQPSKPVSARRSGLEARRHLMNVFNPVIDLVMESYAGWGVQVGKVDEDEDEGKEVVS